MELLTDRFPFVAVSIAFAVNKEVSKTKKKEGFTISYRNVPVLIES